MENMYFSDRPHVGHLIKGSYLGASYNKSAPCLMWCWYIFCRLIYVFCCHVTPQNHSVKTSCIFICESSSQLPLPLLPLPFSLKRLVATSILIVRGNILHQKRQSYKYALPLKNWADWTITTQEKNVTTSKMYILARSASKLKKRYFSSYDYLIWLCS